MPDESPLIQAAVEFTANLIPVRPLRPGRKPPLSDETGAAITITDQDLARAFFEAHPDSNLGACLAPIEGSPIVVVDVDICDVPSAEHAWVWQMLRDLGLSSKTPAWIQRTGRGNTQIIYYAGDLYWEGGDAAIPLRHHNAGGRHVDLLSNGYVVVPPSNTKDEPPKRQGAVGGGPYTWVASHSPLDIPLSDLAPIPPGLLAWWRRLCQPSREPTADARLSRGPAAALLKARIASYRNETLTKIAGLLAQKHEPSLVRELLISVNLSHCTPPLPIREVETIARSIGGRESRKPQTAINQERNDERSLLA